ncbi:MAG: TonB family protein [Acidobacteriota bacterium]|nr:TonB family protein [Acidobacteriota bacterium]
MLTEGENLISAGASIIRAVSNGDADDVRALLAEGADVDQRSRGGQTALIIAAIFNHVKIARLLLAAGADMRLQDNLGLTAREWADRRGSSEVAQLLSNASNTGLTPSPKNAPSEQYQTEEAEPMNPAAEAKTALQQHLPGRTEEQPRPEAYTERREEEETFHASQVETGIASQQDAPSVADEQQRTMADLGRSRAGEERPTATQSARIVATIEHLRILEESRQRVETEVRAKSQRATPASLESVERGHLGVPGGAEPPPRPSMAAGEPYSLGLHIDRSERDTRQENPPAEQFTRPAMLEPETSEALNPVPVKRCPKCNTTYANALLAYCAYDATKLISADESLFNPPAAGEWSRPTLWALVAIIAVLGALLGYLINNYRSTEKANAPIAEQSEQPEIARKDLPLIEGALSGMEVDVPEPEYPAPAKAEGVSGTVAVRVQVNKNGRVISARSFRGDRRLRAAAVKAAQKATFSAEKLAGRGAKGTIIYNFKAQTESPATTGLQPPTETNPPSANGSSSTTGSSATSVSVDYPVVGGPLVGAESNLPQPDYPEKAKSKAISGTITVVVRVNRAGKVVSWRTLGGDSRLRAAALKAAKKATFYPEKLPSRGEVVGTITYNFNL